MVVLVTAFVISAVPFAAARTVASGGGGAPAATTTVSTPTTVSTTPTATTEAPTDDGPSGAPPKLPSCADGAITNTAAPQISPTSGEVPIVVSTTTGGWSSCNSPITGYQYQWRRNGTVVASGSSSYTATSADVGSSITSAVAACNAWGCSSYVGSNAGSFQNQSPPPNSPPLAPSEHVTPSNGAIIDGRGSTPFYMKYSDPNGDSGYITYTIRNASGQTVGGSPLTGPTVVSGADSIAYTQTDIFSGSYS